MIIFEFSIEDLARTRFAISPMWELATSLRMLRDPERAAMHLPWMREALPIARELELETAFALTPSQGYMPDFLTPPPTGPLAEIEEELAEVGDTSAAQIRIDIGKLLREHRRPSAPIEAVIEHPKREVRRLVEVLREFWTRAVEPHWSRMRALLEEDIAHHAQRLAAAGAEGLFADMSPFLAWRDGRLEVDQTWVDEIRLEGRGMLLVPSAFQWQMPASITSEPWQPTVLYPARGIGLLWEPEAPADGKALAGVLGETRARLLALLEAPRSTTDLSRRTGVTPGGVSQHLAALRAAHLVASERRGRTVLYVRTELADRLVRGGSE